MVLKVNKEVSIPAYIVANGSLWEVKVPGAQPVCWKCGDVSHLAGVCRVPKRDELTITKWDEELGMSIEVLFPSRRMGNMGEEDFKVMQAGNHARGEMYGKRVSRNEENLEHSTVEISSDISNNLKNQLMVNQKTIMDLNDAMEQQAGRENVLMSDLKNAMDEIEKTRSVLIVVDKEELEQLRAEKEQANKHSASLKEEIERLRVKLISADEEIEEVDSLREHLSFSRAEKEEATNQAFNYTSRLSTLQAECGIYLASKKRKGRNESQSPRKSKQRTGPADGSDPDSFDADHQDSEEDAEKSMNHEHENARLGNGIP